MSVSRIFLFKTKEEAVHKFGQYSAIDGNNVLFIGPADIFRIEGQSSDRIEWDSGGANDWYMVIATSAPVGVRGVTVSQE